MEKTGMDGRQNCLLRPEIFGIQQVRLIGSSQGRARSPLGRWGGGSGTVGKNNVSEVPEDEEKQDDELKWGFQAAAQGFDLISLRNQYITERTKLIHTLHSLCFAL